MSQPCVGRLPLGSRIPWRAVQGEGGVGFVPDRVVFTGRSLENIDFSKASIGDVVWKDCRLKHVRFDGARSRHALFRSGLISEASFRDTDLRDTHWGSNDKAGPDVV